MSKFLVIGIMLLLLIGILLYDPDGRYAGLGFLSGILLIGGIQLFYTMENAEKEKQIQTLQEELMSNKQEHAKEIGRLEGIIDRLESEVERLRRT